MEEREEFFNDTSRDGSWKRPNGTYRVDVTVPGDFLHMMEVLALKDNLNVSEAIMECIRVGIWFLKDREDGGTGGLAYLIDGETDTTSLVSTTEMLETAKTLHPGLPITVLPDQLLGTPEKNIIPLNKHT